MIGTCVIAASSEDEGGPLMTRDTAHSMTSPYSERDLRSHADDIPNLRYGWGIASPRN